MNLLKEFFVKRTLINCLVFALPVSLLFLWRFVSLRSIPFFSADALQIYLVFVVLDFLFILFVFFILFWLSKRKQEYD
ncbi:MAG: hypothetical protein K9G49_02005 [Taibaiella sp.]|nr:hypothetical protein [Taibaiella sp.]